MGEVRPMSLAEFSRLYLLRLNHVDHLLGSPALSRIAENGFAAQVVLAMWKNDRGSVAEDRAAS
jgi:hypothetical protein